MYRSSFRRMIVALALGVALLSPWAAAAEPRIRTEPSHMPRIAELPLDFMTQLWNLLSRAWAKNGCSLDPHGICTTSPSSDPTVQGDTGCGIDPNGGCAGH